MEFPGVLIKNSKWYFQRLIRNNLECPGVIKKKPCRVSRIGVLILGLKISESCDTI